MPETPTETDCRPDLYLHTLKQLREGRTQKELSDLLSQVVQAVREVGKQGSVTLKINIAPIGKNCSGQYELRGDVKADIPQFPAASTIFFGTPQGNLQRNDPNQQTLEFTTVTKEKPTEYKTAQEAN